MQPGLGALKHLTSPMKVLGQQRCGRRSYHGCIAVSLCSHSLHSPQQSLDTFCISQGNDSRVQKNPNSSCILTDTRQHNVVPDVAQLKNVTHVALAFMRSEIFNEPDRTEWPLFTTLEEVRSKFPPNTVVQVAIGGWGNTDGFSEGAKTEQSRQLFARNIKSMLEATGADGSYKASFHSSH